MKMKSNIPERPTPSEYQDLFERDPRGARILEDLVLRFGGNPYTRGGLDGARETDYRSGSLRVVTFILSRINQANGVESTEEE